MNQLGEHDNLLVAARSALLDALEALDGLRESVIVVGAQAVYLHTGSADVALAEATKDSDLVVDPRELAVLSHQVGDTRLMGVPPMPVWMRSVL